MPYTLHRLAAGSYDLLLDGALIGSVVRETSCDHATGWWAELLEDLPRARRPKPFKQVEHRFETFGDVVSWLGADATAEHTM
ncbi:hypothetical protein MOX02_36730 [Methylobacterium oxalidis]|uniref:Uncharacterized protein n=1 Tax=Methylobacterium oxalidis TaxID=944322 RepID=A0A512J6M3_9HYPH|nr:hypothetical protein MOX02_36730 [Methylobacterium oxalidis]GLS65385.1 hypothetical protein GCM10007888_37670 [Methylobacterium oxalidis]